MKKIGIIRIESGDFADGFKLNMSLQSSGTEASDILPSNHEILPLYARWNNKYKEYGKVLRKTSSLDINTGDDYGYKASPTEITNVEDKETCYQNLVELQAALYQNMKSWLEHISKDFRESLVRDIGGLDNEYALIIEVFSFDIGKEIYQLPWHNWSLLEKYEKLEVSFAIGSDEKAFDQLFRANKVQPLVEVLAIISSSTDPNKYLDTSRDISLLKSNDDLHLEILENPNKNNLLKILKSDYGWNILFYAGHSSTSQNGVISIKDEEYIDINELQEGLQVAAQNGLKLAIFNSCDGIGLAKGVLDSGIPFTIVMRDSIPDVCAKYFLEQFISEYIKQGLSLHTAVRLAKMQLSLKYEQDYPGVANLPIIMQYPKIAPPVWHELRGIESPYKGLQPFTENDNAFFFGREKVLKKLRQLVDKNSVIFITGEAGSGKTSLVKIGLIPFLKQKKKWAVIEYSILSYSSLDNIYSDLASVIQENSNSPIIIIIDRYERVMHFDSDCQTNFIEKITSINHDKLKFVFMSNKATFHEESLTILELEYMRQTEESLIDIITKPAQLFEVYFEEGLSQILINDMTASSTNMPFLQLLLEELWNHKKQNQTITHNSYRALGGACGIIGRYAEYWHEKLSKLSSKNFTENIHIILTKLVRIDDSNDYISNSIHQDTLLVSSIETHQEFNLLIEKMESDRIIRSIFEGDERYFQIYHSALVSEWLIHQNWFCNYYSQMVDVHWVEEKHNQWNLMGKSKKSYLLRHEDLSRALAIQDNLKKFLSKKAICFIETSDRESKNQKKKLKLGVIFAFASFAGLLSISPHFYYSNIVSPRLFKNSESLRKTDTMAGLLSAISIFLQDKSFESQLLLWKSLHESYEKQQFNTTNNMLVAPRFSSSENSKFLVIDGDSILIKSTSELSNTVVIKGEQHNISFADFSPSHPHYLVTASYDKSAIVWDINSKKIISKMNTDNHINHSSFNPENPNQLLTVGGNGEAILWALDKPTYLQGHKKEIFMGVFSTKNSKRILTIGQDSIANIWDSNTPGRPIHSLVHDGLPISSGEFSPHDENIISTIVDREIYVWRTGKFQSHQILKGHTGRVIQTLFNPVNPNQIVSLTENGECLVWDIRSGRSTPIGIKNIHRAAFYPKSGLLLTVGSDQLARVWKITTQADEIKQYPIKPTDSLKYLTFDPKNPDQFLTTMINSNTVRLWNLKAKNGIELSLDKYSQKNQFSPAITASFNPGMNQVLTINRDSTLNIWDTQNIRQNDSHPSKIIPMPKKINVVEKAWFSKSFPQRVVILNDKGVLYLWNYDNNELLEMKQEMGEAVQEVRFADDFSNKILVISDYKVSIWNPLKGSIDIAPGREYKYKIVNAEFIPENSSSSVIMIDRTGRIYTWNINTGEQKNIHSKSLNTLSDFKFMPKYFTGKMHEKSDNKNIELIDIGLSENTLVKAPLAEIRSYTSVKYSDKKSFLISDNNGKVEVFDIASLYERLVIKPGGEKNTFIELSPDKLTQSIVIDSAGKTSLYNIGGEDLLKIAFNNMSRCLSRQEINEFWTNRELLEQYYTKFQFPKTTNEYNQLRCQ